ncbi:MAG TPA: hypothetical protein VK420_04020 [Longimicrobium sp.]|nr:hypothetical protein [Longimicrobium sp.]
MHDPPANAQPGGERMFKVRVVKSVYDGSERYVGQVGEVIGHWGPDNSESGREGHMVQFPDGTIVGLSEEEIEAVTGEE